MVYFGYVHVSGRIVLGKQALHTRVRFSKLMPSGKNAYLTFLTFKF